MLEVADIVRAAGPEVCAQLAVLPSQKRALQAIQLCRTTALGGQVYGCEQCGALHYSYHSCGNRHCPKCHGQQTQRWLEQQRTRLLPCPYYLLTFTLPAQLRTPARSHQKLVYGLLLNAAAASVQKLCADPQWLGAQVSLMGCSIPGPGPCSTTRTRTFWSAPAGCLSTASAGCRLKIPSSCFRS